MAASLFSSSTMAKTHMLQLDPTIPVITADGEGEAIGWLDYSKDDDLMWIVFLKKNGECWIYPNSKVRAVPNITFGRMPHESAHSLAEQIKQPHPHPGPDLPPTPPAAPSPPVAS